jgi:hypothetical protein
MRTSTGTEVGKAYIKPFVITEIRMLTLNYESLNPYSIMKV